MQPINEVYDSSAHGWGDYQPMIDSMGYEVVCQQDVGGYQGDTLAIVRDGERHGFLTFGWGSCSGCDALQSCSTLHEVHELRQEIHDQIVWKGSAQEMVEFLRDRDWKAQFYSDRDEVMEFVAKAIGALAEVK